ncbi:MAG: FUSC family protein [Solirubrobacterales bacterium]
MPSSRREPGLFNASGLARRLPVASLLAIGPARPGPAIRRGFLVAVPVGLSLVLELGFNAPTKGAIGTGALLAGFPGLDAPARPRAAWQAAAAPAIALAGALGILSSQTAPTAVLAMALLGAAAGYCFSVSLRLAIYGLSVALGMLVAQGFFLPVSDVPAALLYVTAGGLLQALWSLLVWLFFDRAADDGPSGWDTGRALAALRENWTLSSPAARHGIRFGAALGAGVLVYRVFDLEQHGFWIPLTILFVMRPEREATDQRLVLRAVGTVLGLVIATALAETLHQDDLVIALLLTVAAALSFGLLTVQYALFTAAITTYVVLMVDTLGEGAWEAAGQRVVGTAVGIAIAFLAFLVWPNPGEGGGLRRAPARRRIPPRAGVAR